MPATLITPVLVIVILPVALVLTGEIRMPVAAVALPTTVVGPYAVFWNVPSWKVMPRLPVPPVETLGKLTP